MRLPESRAKLKRNLGSTTEWIDEVLDGAVARAVDDLSRVLPRELIHDITMSWTVTDESWSTHATVLLTWITLANARIKPGSEVVTNVAETVTYVRDTDYTMDYANGKIIPITGGLLAINTSYRINYTRLEVTVSLSDLADLVRVNRIEFPGGQVPARFQSFYTWGQFLSIGKPDLLDEGQLRMAEDSHMWLYYQAMQTPPSLSADGSFPAMFDEIILKGAEAYAILEKAVELRTTARTNLALAVTELSNVSGSITSAGTSLDSAGAAGAIASDLRSTVATYLAALDTALTNVTALLAKAETSINRAETSASQATVDLTQVSINLNRAVSELANVSAVIQGALTRLSAAQSSLTQASSDLDQVPALLSSGTSQLALATTATGLSTQPLANAEAKLGAIDERITDVDSYIDIVNNDLLDAYQELDQRVKPWLEGTESAGDYLGTGKLLINKVNVGESVADMYRRYAEAAATSGAVAMQGAELFISTASRRLELIQSIVMQINALVSQATGYISEVTGRLGAARSYIENASGYFAAATARNNQAAARAGHAEAIIAEGRVRLEAAAAYQGTADRYTAIARVYVDAAQVDNNQTDAYLGAAGRWIEAARTRVSEGEARAAQANVVMNEMERMVSIMNGYAAVAMQRLSMAAHYHATSDRYVQAGNSQSALAKELEAVGIGRKSEFIALITDRAVTRTDSSLSAVK